jgi:LPS export ABC transporter protein LptC
MILVILAISLFFGCKPKKTIAEETQSILEQTIEEFFITQTDKGKIKITIESESVIINEKENIAHLKRPLVKFYDKGKYTSTLIADEGTINTLTYDINGMGKCTIDTLNNGRLETSELFYDGKKELIYSDRDVEIIRPGEIVRGTSFKSDVKLDKITIKNQKTIIEKDNK